MTALRRYETHPKIVMDLLVRHGVFDRIEFFGFVSGSSNMLVLYRPSRQQISVSIETDCGVIRQMIDVGFARTKSGSKPYFVCPDSGARCQELHFYETHFVSRKMHPEINVDKPSPAHRRAAKLHAMRDRLLGQDGLPPVTARERVELLAKLVREPFVKVRFPELAETIDHYLDWVHKYRRRRARMAMAPKADPSASALNLGYLYTDPIDLSIHLARSPREWLETLPEPRDRFGNSPIAYLEDQISLDIRWLARKWKLDDSGVWARRLAWRRLKAVLIVDFRDTDNPLIALRQIEGRTGEQFEDLIIKLVPSAFKSRWFMQCPLSGRRCDVLYWRDDVFASARAARYVHGSQRGRPPG